MLLHGAMAEDLLNSRNWSVAAAADRWREIRERLLSLRESVSEEAEEILEALCFVVDVSLQESLQTGSLSEYAAALQEIADVLLQDVADVKVQTLVSGELQKVVLPV